MTYALDNDLHIHSQLSLCSSDPEQTPGRILRYAQENHLKHICLTDHYWDENVPGATEWYQVQNMDHIRASLPLPEARDVHFMFGCETDMDKFYTVGISDRVFDAFDFIIVPINHLHMMGFTIDPENDAPERRAEWYVRRFDALLDMDLPFEKLGLAHLTCPLLSTAAPLSHLDVIDLISDDTYRELFTRVARLDCGVELNLYYALYKGADVERVLRPYRIAASVGCKFYFGSDAHHPHDLEAAPANFASIRDALELKEEQKFLPQ